MKVLDFGISKVTALGERRAELDVTTHADHRRLAALHVARADASSKTVDARTDIWSLGVILFELVSNRAPFEAEEMPALLMRIMTQPPQSLQTIAPGVPAELEAVVGRCLEKDRDARFGNVAQLAVALRPFAPQSAAPSVERIARIVQTAGLGTASGAPAAPPAPVAAPVAPTQASWGQASIDEAPSARPRPAMIALFLILMLAAVAGVAAVVLGRRAGFAVGETAAQPAPSAAAPSEPAVPSLSSTASAPASTAPPSPSIPLPTPAPAACASGSTRFIRPPPPRAQLARSAKPPVTSPNVYDHM